MDKILNLNKSVFEIVKEYPEIKGILFELGFKDIITSGMLNTAGRFMTIPKGAAMKKIDMKLIVSTFEEKGFSIQL